MGNIQLVSNRSKAHQVYRTASGLRVPGVTTITGVLDKPALLYWAWNLGMQGIDYKKHRDELAGVGSLAHDMISCHLRGVKCDTSAYSAREIDLAENAFIKFLEWEGKHKLQPIFVEKQFVREALKGERELDVSFGGTLDFYGTVDGTPRLLDFKTGKAVYPEMYYQLAGYRHLLEHLGHPVPECQILRIGRTEDERFEEGPVIQDMTLQWRMFDACHTIYNLKRQLDK